MQLVSGLPFCGGASWGRGPPPPTPTPPQLHRVHWVQRGRRGAGTQVTSPRTPPGCHRDPGRRRLLSGPHGGRARAARSVVSRVGGVVLSVGGRRALNVMACCNTERWLLQHGALAAATRSVGCCNTERWLLQHGALAVAARFPFRKPTPPRLDE
jgi:hypothetical protein